LAQKVTLSPDQLLEARRLWLAGESQQGIAAAVGITIDTLKARLRDQLEDLHRLAPQLLAAGVLRNGDCEALARLCWLHTQWRKHAQLCERGADIIVMKDEAGKIRYAQVSPSATLVSKFAGLMAKLEAEFGLTPSSRSSLVVTENPTSTLDQWLRDHA
jgi:P27 family predicted phage terminase small subunit